LHSPNPILVPTVSGRQRVATAATRLFRLARHGIRRSGIVERLFAHARWFGIAVAIAVIAGSFVVLFHQLKGLDPDEVIVALQAHPPQRIAFAALFIAGAYATLTFYDWFALRTIGATHIPYRIAALASFTSYSIGHNVGATAFSGGAIRYRIYSGRGLRVVDVAKICFVTGLTFWLGNITVLGLGMIVAPEAATSVDQLPPEINRVLGIAALSALIGYVTWVSCGERRIGRDNWSLVLPGGISTLVQIGIGFLDLTFCSLAMYMLMPSEPYYGFVTVAVVFVSATLLGFASHSPGSLGVFDAAMVFAFAAVDKEELVAALLLFRLMYFVTPFVLALSIMAVRETMIALWRRSTGATAAGTSSKLHV
jgi:uncharacterized membrane protein YbhN (UPF0104 family)